MLILLIFLLRSIRTFYTNDYQISSGEYIQMSGRAGRRGVDDRGIVIATINERIQTSDIQHLMQGKSAKLISAFRLSYNMILNLSLLEGVKPDFLLERSFCQFQNNGSIPSLEQGKRDTSLGRRAISILMMT